MNFELLKLDLDLSLQLPNEISSVVTRMVQHDPKYTGTNILVLVLVSKGSGNSVITLASCPPSTTYFSQFQHHLTEILGLLLFTCICENQHAITERHLLSRREVKKLNNIKVLPQKSGFLVFWILQFRLTCFLNEHWKTEVQHKPFKKRTEVEELLHERSNTGSSCFKNILLFWNSTQSHKK